MDDRQLEMLLAMQVEADELAADDAGAAAVSAAEGCPRMARLALVGAALPPASQKRVAQPSTRRAWVGVAAALAACLALYLTPARHTHRPERGNRGVIEFANPFDFPGLTSVGTCVSGDADCNGVVTYADLSALILEVHRPDLYADRYTNCDPMCTSDMNHDGVVDENDIREFLQCVEPG